MYVRSVVRDLCSDRVLHMHRLLFTYGVERPEQRRADRQPAGIELPVVPSSAGALSLALAPGLGPDRTPPTGHIRSPAPRTGDRPGSKAPERKSGPDRGYFLGGF